MVGTFNFVLKYQFGEKNNVLVCQNSCKVQTEKLSVRKLLTQRKKLPIKELENKTKTVSDSETYVH